SQLTSPGTVTRRLIMQKARRHPSSSRYEAPTACKRMVSGSVSPRYSRCFSPFLHGTGSLSVSQQYLALPDGAGKFTRGVSDPALLRILPLLNSIRLRASHPLWTGFPPSST